MKNLTFLKTVTLFLFLITAYSSFGQCGGADYKWTDNPSRTYYSGERVEYNGKIYTPCYSSTTAPLSGSWNRDEGGCQYRFWGFVGNCQAVCNNFTNAGSINGTQTSCGSYNPGTIGNASNPSGGSGGSTQYQWQISSNNSSWGNITGATGSSYNPPTITSTRYYRRAVRRNCGSTNIYTASITKAVTSNFTNAGSINGAQTSCSSYNPSNMGNASNPSGGSGGSTQYQWQISSNNSSWSNISGASGSSYNAPTTITSTKYYRRAVRRNGCSTYIYTASITKAVTSNFTNAGSISGAQTSCSSYNPSNMGNASSPSGGSGGSTQYQWQISSNNSSWSNISGASGSSYDPPSTITSTKYYRRAVRRSGCNTYIYTVSITKAVTSNFTNAGSINGAETSCSSYNPSNMGNASSPSGGSGGGTQYQWQISSNNSSWSNISGASGSSYDPPSTITSTKYYRRAVRRSGCNTYIYTASITKAVTSNLTDAGSINGAQTSCSSYNPSNMGNAGNPSGGSGGSIEYQWQYKTTGGWNNIGSSNSATYDPSTISITTQYQRGARRSGCSTYIYTASITKAVTSNLTDAGSIIGAETSCSSYNPSNMGNASSPSGGSGGSIEYQWQYKTTGGWNNIGSSNSATYDPSTISITTQYQRGARRNGCSTYIFTASITKAVTSNLTDAGSINGAETSCSSYNPSNMGNASSPSGGSGGSIEYQWQYKTTGGWNNIGSSNSATYDPSTISITTQYQRGARRNGCSTYIYTASITKAVTSNLTDAGSINGAQTSCSSYNPSNMGNASSPSGGSGGSIEYQWQYKTTGGWNNIGSSNSATYDPSTISITTQYQRGARRNGCSTYIYTASITKAVTSNLTDAGSINGAQTSCSSYNPSNMGNASSPSGGSGGSIEYQWQYKTTGGWNNIGSSNSATYDPSTISITTQYQRGARRNGCSTYIYTASITKAVTSNLTDAGSINGAQTSCSSYNPSNMGNASSPSGGSGGSIEYQWQYKTTGGWNNIGSSNSATYDPSTISITTQYQRGARRNGCSTYIYTASITKAVTSNLTDAGSINGAQTACSSYNPSNMGNAGNPSGGSGGSIEYQWQYKTTGGWNNIGSSNSATYDPSTISITTQYQRGARRNGCSTYIYTASITKAVTSNLTDAGSINGAETSCGSYNPSNMGNASSPSGGSGGSIEYQWQYKTTGGWNNIGSSNSATYDPSTISITTQYQRGARRNGCSTYIYTASITKAVTSNLTDAGSINGAQTSCGSYKPSNMGNASSPSGGSGGSIEYQWLISSDNSNWSNIIGATGSSYDPPSTITSTKYYRRAVKRSGCSTYLYTASITKAVDALPVISSPVDQRLCDTSDFTMAQSESIGSGVWTVLNSSGTAPTITDINYPTTTVTGLPAGTSAVLRWTVTNGSCSISDDVSIQNDAQIIADNTTSVLSITEDQTKILTGAPSGGTWSIVAGSGSITGSTYTPTDINTAASVTIRYTIAADGACVATTDDVIFTATPVCAVASNTTSTASITELQTKSLEGSPSGGTWSIVSGGGTISGTIYTPADITADTSITIKYTIASDGSCDATTSVRSFTVTPVVIFWNGSEDNDWSNVNNWSTNYLPANNNAVVVIPGGLSNYPTATEPVSVNSVIMNSGSSLIAKEIFTGALTYRRTLSNWHLIASPVFGETIENMYLKNNFIQAGNGDIGLAPYQHDSNTWGFYKDTSTGTITSGQGYSSKLASLGDVSFTGTMATTDISISSIGRTIDYNLVGNPYPSYLNIESFLNDNSDSLEEMTLWMDSYDVIEQKSVYQPISLVSNLKHIAPAQGFFVQPKEESTVLNFTEDMQSHQSVDTFEKTSSSERPEIKLLITNGTSTKYTDIFYIEGTTTGFDNGYDSSIFNSTASFSLYTNTITNSSGRKLAIQSLPNSDYESMVVPVGITADADKEITFSATAINLPAGIKVYLEDRELNVFTELIAVDTDVYKVDLAAAVNGVGRFYLHTSQKVLDVSDVPILTNIKIYTTTNTNLRIVGLPEAAKALKLYNIIGQEIMSTSFNTNGVKDIALPNLSKGVYTVQLKIGSEIIREKIFLE